MDTPSDALGLLELVDSIPGYMTFGDIESFLNDESISTSMKEVFVSKVDQVSFTELHKFFLSKGDKSERYILELVRKLDRVSFEEIEEPLRKKELPKILKVVLINKIERVRISQIRVFLSDESIDREIRRFLAEKIIYSFDTKRYLRNTEHNGGVRSRAVEVNIWQHKLLVGDIVLPEAVKNIPKERTLNFYYRDGQGAFKPHFEIIIKLLKEFIEGGNSQVWNNFQLLSRWQPTEKRIGGVDVQNISGLGFRSQSTIYADTIHLTHGTPEKIPGTHAIVGKGLYRDGHKLEGIYYSKKQYSRIPLLYTRFNPGAGLGFPMDMTIKDISDTILKSLQTAEKRILESIG